MSGVWELLLLLLICSISPDEVRPILTQSVFSLALLGLEYISSLNTGHRAVYFQFW